MCIKTTNYNVNIYLVTKYRCYNIYKEYCADNCYVVSTANANCKMQNQTLNTSMEEVMECGKIKSASLPVEIPSAVSHAKTPEIHVQLQNQAYKRKDLTDSDELMFLYESYATDINSNTPVMEFKASQLRLYSTGSTGLGLSPTTGHDPGPSSHSENLQVPQSKFFNTPQSSFFNTYSLNDAFDSLVVNPFRNFHENLRKKLLLLKNFKENQDKMVKMENSEVTNTDSSDFHIIGSFPTNIGFETEEVFKSDSELDTDEYIEGTRKRRSLCSTPDIGSIKIPKTPWHSPARDADDIFIPTKVLNYGCDDLVLKYPIISKSYPLSPGEMTKFSSDTNNKGTHLCRVFAPSWLQWRPEMHAFICDYKQNSTTGYYIDLYLSEPNPNNQCHIVEEEHYQTPGMEEKIPLNIPHGMKWVKMSSGSGFLVTTTHLGSLGARACLPSAWKSYTNSVILSRTRPPKEISGLSASQ